MRCLTAAFGLAPTPTRARFVSSDLGHDHLLWRPLSRSGTRSGWITDDQVKDHRSLCWTGHDPAAFNQPNEPVEVPCLWYSRSRNPWSFVVSSGGSVTRLPLSPGGPCESRSRHLGIKSPLLYRMS